MRLISYMNVFLNVPRGGEVGAVGVAKLPPQARPPPLISRVRSGKSSTLVASSSTTVRKKKEGFSSKITIPDFCGKEGHTNEATNAFRAWARSITYYHDYYQDSYLMPLVVTSLKGDATDVFDWTRTLDPDNTQDLSTLLQMLREHYCGSLMFREQRNMVENLHQKSQESGVDFLI